MSQIQQEKKYQQISTIDSFQPPTTDVIVQKQNRAQQIYVARSNIPQSFSLNADLIQIINLSQNNFNKVNVQNELDAFKRIKSLFSDQTSIVIFRMRKMLPINQKIINQNLYKMQTRFKRIHVQIKQYSQYVLVLINTNSSQKQCMQNQSEKEISESVSLYRWDQNIVKINSCTSCKLKFINIELFQEDIYEFSQAKIMIQKINIERVNIFNNFFKDSLAKNSKGDGTLRQINSKINIPISQIIQTQVILTFNSIQQLLQTYQRSQKDSQFGRFFYIQPYNQKQNEQNQIIELEKKDFPIFSLQVERVLNNNGQFLHLNELFEQTDDFQDQTNFINVDQNNSSSYSENDINQVNGHNMSEKQLDPLKLQNQSNRQQYLGPQLQQTIEKYCKQQKINQNQIPPEKMQKIKLEVINRINLKVKDKYTKSHWGQLSPDNGIYKIQSIISNAAFPKSHIFKLKSWMNQNFIEALKDMAKNQEVYAILKKQIIKFMRINQYKWFKAKELYQKLYPQMLPLIKYFLSKAGILTIEKQLDNFVKENRQKYQMNATNTQKIKEFYLQKLRQQLGIKQHFLDQIYYEYLKIQQNKPEQRSVIISVNTKQIISLSYLFNQVSQFSIKMLKRMDVLNTLLYQYKINSPKNIKENNKILGKTYYLDQFSSIKICEIQCLGCTPFFYENMNIRDRLINKSPLQTFQFIQKLKTQQIYLKREICSMMNKGGGVILFNCLRKYGQIFPQGASLTQKDKQKYEQQIYSLIECFYPKIEIGSQILINFVPVVRNPYQNNGRSERDYEFNLDDYIVGKYVTRIIICPINATKVYFWQHERQDRCYWSYKVLGKIYQIKYHKAYKQLKYRFNDFYISQHYKGRQRKMMEKPNNFFNHICKRPELGIPITQNSRTADQRMVRQSTSFVNFQRRYTYVSMIIAKKSDHQAIKRKFQSRGIKCEIEQKFKNYKFKNAKNTAILYHNTRFENLLNIISFNPQFQFNTKMVLLIRVTEYIKLMNRNAKSYLTVDDYKHLCEWLKAEFPHEKMQVWEFRLSNGSIKQFYLSTGSKNSTVFMYFVLSHFSQKAIFKNPANLDQLQQQQKKLVWFQRTKEYDEKLRIKLNQNLDRQLFTKIQPYKFHNNQILLFNIDDNNNITEQTHEFIFKTPYKCNEIFKIYQYKYRLKLINVQQFIQDNYHSSEAINTIQKIKLIRFQSIKNVFGKIQSQNEQIENSQLAKVEIVLIISQIIQIQIILTFKDFQEFLQVYQRSLLDRYFNKFFYFQPFKSIQSESSRSLIQLQNENFHHFNSFIKRLKIQGDQNQKIQQRQSQGQQLFDEIDDQKNSVYKIQKKFKFKQLSYLNTSCPQIISQQNLIKNKALQKQQYIYCQRTWESAHLNRQINAFENIFNLNHINQRLAKSHIFQFKSLMNQNFMEILKDMSKHYQAYTVWKDEIIKFMRINQYKWFRTKELYQRLYPQMPFLIRYFLNKAGIPSIEKQLDSFLKGRIGKEKIDPIQTKEAHKQYYQGLRLQLGMQPQHFLDQIYYEYLEQKLSKKGKQKEIKINILITKDRPVSMPEFINKYTIFFTNFSHNFDVLNTLLYKYVNALPQKGNIRPDYSQYLDNFSQKRILEIECLGCTPFFYEAWNIKDENINKSPVTPFQSIKYFDKYILILKREICSMMNSGGGVILFDCVYKYGQILPYGAKITETDKQSYEQKIYSLLPCFYPNIQREKNLLVSFVPVATHPLQQNKQNEEDCDKNEVNYIKGCYVTRIRVCPTDATQIYFWHHKQKQKYYWSYKHCQRLKKLRYHQAYKLLKQKFNEFYIPNLYNARQKKMMEKQSNYFNHTCKIPELGNCI